MFVHFSRKLLAVCAFCFVGSIPVFSDERLGADLAAPQISALLEKLPLTPNSTYTLTDSDTEQLVSLAANIHINVFEIIDDVFRYVTPRSIRIVMEGSSLRRLQTKFDLGGDRVLSILSVSKIRYLEFGARLKSGQKDLDIYLESPVQTYIEIGTAVYETRYGFNTLKPLLFDNAYGITVKKMIISTPLEKLVLFSPGKGAIYVKGLSRPKKWNLDVITPIH